MEGLGPTLLRILNVVTHAVKDVGITYSQKSIPALMLWNIRHPFNLSATYKTEDSDARIDYTCSAARLLKQNLVHNIAKFAQ